MSDYAPSIERGVALARRLPQIMPDDAQGETRRVYDDIRATLRVPFVNFIFRALANDGPYLAAEWDRLRPWAASRDFERAADDIRAAALPSTIDLPTVDWAAQGDLGRIRPFTESIHYVLPKLLLLATAMHDPRERDEAPETQPAIPQGVAEGTQSLPMVDPAKADPPVHQIFERIKNRHGHPTVATYYRALGQWPDFLAAAWNALDPLIGAAPYGETKQSILRQATDYAANTAPSRRPDQTATGLSAADRHDLLAVFRFRVVPDLLLDVTLIRAMLDGREAARTSQFSVA